MNLFFKVPNWYLKHSHEIMIPVERIEKSIFLIRDQKVMLDEHLAELYDVETKSINRAIKRNFERFPSDFMFQLDEKEYDILKNHLTVPKGRGQHRKYLPYVFTEQGVAMLSSVLKSRRAVQVNIEIIRAFVRLREIMSTHKDVVQKINAMEKKYDYQIKSLFDAIRELMASPVKTKKSIGFERES